MQLLALALKHPDAELLALGGTNSVTLSWAPENYESLEGTAVALVQHYGPLQLPDGTIQVPSTDLPSVDGPVLDVELGYVCALGTISIIVERGVDGLHTPGVQLPQRNSKFEWYLRDIKRPVGQAPTVDIRAGVLQQIELPDGSF